MPTKTIYVIEDDEPIRETLTVLLESEGYAVKTAENGQLALDYLHTLAPSELPHLILVDLMMPVKDGFQFCLEKGASAKIKNIPVIIMSGDARIDEKFKQTGAVDFLVKPVNIDSIIDKVNRFSA